MPGYDAVPAQRVNGGRAPMRQVGHRRHCWNRTSRHGRAGQRVKRLGEQGGTGVQGTVGGDDADRVADTVDEVVDPDTATADHRPAGDNAPGTDRGERGDADREAEGTRTGRCHLTGYVGTADTGVTQRMVPRPGMRGRSVGSPNRVASR